MLFIFLILINGAKAGELEPVLEPIQVRCKYVSSSSVVVTHYFKIHEFDFKQCEYGIKVNEQIILSDKAFNQDCRDFMRKQINKGSVCMTNQF